MNGLFLSLSMRNIYIFQNALYRRDWASCVRPCQRFFTKVVQIFGYLRSLKWVSLEFFKDCFGKIVNIFVNQITSILIKGAFTWKGILRDIKLSLCSENIFTYINVHFAPCNTTPWVVWMLLKPLLCVTSFAFEMQTWRRQVDIQKDDQFWRSNTEVLQIKSSCLHSNKVYY